MKSIKYLIPVLFGLMAVFSSCKKWLDVSPKTQVREEVQFSTGQGFIDALFGIYQTSAKTTGYGRNMSFGFVDILAQQYAGMSVGSPFGTVARYNYTDTAAEKRISEIFSNSYGAIAQANYILKNIDNGVLDQSSKQMIQGEALGMRGFLHFDLVRLFAPIYNGGANASVSSLAYLKAFTVVPQSRLPLKDYLDLVESDLKAAEGLLSANQNIDQIAGNQGSTSSDLFLMFRQNHLNYWAVKATLARLYQYRGDKVNALKYALEVINSTKFKFVAQPTLIVDPLEKTSDLTFSSEHIFSFYVSGLKKLADDSFKSSTSSTFYGDIRDFYTAKATLEATYQGGTVGYGTDIRKVGVSKSLWNEINTSIVYTKKYYSDNDKSLTQRLIPAIRLSEMYYIAAEAAPTLVDGMKYLNVVRAARLIPELPTPANQANLETEITLEYRKEFYAEGQLWYYYKRKNVLNIPNGVGNPMNAAKYVLPLPNDELQFGASGI
ncbi:RagB/SusD family nutrient uptake outer membrane protein [Pedobacter hiemivivus]|uniref:RagB/SusD family nutrient uptake outer membrane protein n=1 Tax=Pedobacter hiemivivus TaxID=2530454 RepID=A0A4R0NJZ0_9SPHI|nr:RagB/SusD family nutrient uptake outer membrane protein [Pedobacter hiemivivus]TCC99234.1 RagB/SusD family nutrient uptake outer membrane protein [Pedobacter hiemivivus]